MQLAEGLKINTPQVVHETIDGETILLNLDRGIYYSLNDTGTVLWALIENNYPTRQIIENLISHWEVSAEIIDSAINNFLEQLVAEGLVLPIQMGPVENMPNPIETILSSLGGKKTDFSKPLLSKYTDMKDLLVLDPIHDVDDSGWPSAKTIDS